MTTVFDGKRIADEIRVALKKEIAELSGKKITPKMVSFLVGEEQLGKKYLSLKKAAAADIGAKLEIRDFGRDTKPEEIIDEIQDLNIDENVHGIMIQLPLPHDFSEDEREQIISAISKKKDVDGMKKESRFVAPVVKAVLLAIKSASQEVRFEEKTLFVVNGAEGFVGEKILWTLEDMGFRTKGVDVTTKEKEKIMLKADVLISSTGKEEIIGADVVKDQVVVIDVGAPKADVKNEVKEKAAFITPVPGGIGPLTIAFLLENLVEAAKDQG